MPKAKMAQLLTAICFAAIVIGALFLARQGFIAFLNYIVPPY
jgi:hypothetical protein